MKTYMAKGETLERKWYVIDADGMVLGRLASQVAAILRGKHKPIYTPHVDTGDHVIIVNAAKVTLTGRKLDGKKYVHHTGYPGGLKEFTYRQLMAKKPEEAVDEHPEQNRHTKGSWYYVWKGEYEIMECFPEYLPNTYLNYYLQQKEFVEHSNPERTRANEVEETREKNLFDGIDHYEKTGEIDESTFYAGSHGDWIADLAIALKNDTKQRFLVICENKGAIPNMPYDAMVELPAYIGKNGPEVISRDNIPLFQQGLMMQQLNSEKLIVEATIEGSYEKALKAFTLNKTVPSMKVAKEVLDDMIEANKGYWPELK